MDAFPAFFPLAGRTVVVAGEGDAADAKARLFEGSPAKLIRVCGAEAHGRQAYEGATLAFIAGPQAFAVVAAQAARAAGALVNVVDQPALSDFQTPAIVDRGAVVGAIGTGGAAPLLASRLRGALEAQWPDGLASLAELLRRLQPEIRARLPDLAERRSFLRSLLEGAAAEAALAGDLAAAVALARDAMADPPPRRGVVWVLPLPDAPDQLTLQALRLLGRADRIVADRPQADALIAMARRDAPVTPPNAYDTNAGEALAAWAAAGDTVVRILTPGAPAPDVEAAVGRGTPVRWLPAPGAAAQS